MGETHNPAQFSTFFSLAQNPVWPLGNAHALTRQAQAAMMRSANYCNTLL